MRERNRGAGHRVKWPGPNFLRTASPEGLRSLYSRNPQYKRVVKGGSRGLHLPMQGRGSGCGSIQAEAEGQGDPRDRPALERVWTGRCGFAGHPRHPGPQSLTLYNGGTTGGSRYAGSPESWRFIVCLPGHLFSELLERHKGGPWSPPTEGKGCWWGQGLVRSPCWPGLWCPRWGWLGTARCRWVVHL